MIPKYLEHLKIETSQFESRLSDVNLRFGDTSLNLNSCLYTGTNSSALIGILSGEGLLPLGALRALGRVPFSGELYGWGTQSLPKMSINNYAISTTTGADIDFALKYTKSEFNATGWSPALSVEILDHLNKANLDEIEQKGMNRYAENLRNQSWGCLTDGQKDLVKNAFPMFVEISPNLCRLSSDYHLVPIKSSSEEGTFLYEIAIKGGIWSHEINSIFAPENEKEKVEMLLSSHNQAQIHVLEIEPLWERMR